MTKMLSRPRERPIIATILGYYLPGFKAGGPIRTITNLVECLGDEFDFRILTRDRDLGDSEPYPGMSYRAWIQVGKAQVMYLAPGHLRFWAWRNLFDLINYDLLYLNSFFSPLTIKTLMWRRLHKIPCKPTIIAPRGEFSPGALRMRWYKKASYIRVATVLRLYDNLIWQASTPEEASLIRSTLARFRLASNPVIYVAPNLPPRTSSTFDHAKRLQKLPGNLKLVFLARIVENKNLDYALRLLRNLSGQVLLDIYGPLEDMAYWNRCQQIIRDLPPNIRVSYQGEVDPSNVSGTLDAYHALLFPTRGENFGHVILEALSVGCPVVISDQTPWRKLAAQKAGWDLPLADKIVFVEVLQNLVNMDHEEWMQWVHGARKVAESFVNNPAIIEANRRLFYEALKLKKQD